MNIEAIKLSASKTLPISGPAEPPQPAEIAARSRQNIEGRLIREVEAMAIFAMMTGTGVPPKVAELLDRAIPHGRRPSADGNGMLPLPGNGAGPSPAESGSDAATEDRGTAASVDYLSLLAAHFELTRLIAPAKPGTLVLLMEDRRRHPYMNSLGAVPMARTMLIIAVFSLAVLLGAALSNQVNAENLTKGLLNLEGLPLLVNEVFLIAAAAVGASLANLKYLDRYVSSCTYSQRFDGSYWTRLVMGLISGVVLSQLVFGALINHLGPNPAKDSNAILITLGQPVLALLGGFSADLVHDILAHFISAFGYLLGSSSKQRTSAAPPATPAADRARRSRDTGAAAGNGAQLH